MATLIRLKRKVSSGNNGITLKRGEPYYNVSDQRFYIGNEDGEKLDENSIDIAKIQSIEKVLHPTQLKKEPWGESDTVSFQVGGNSENIYEKRISYVENSYRSVVSDTAKEIEGGCVSSIGFDPDENSLVIAYVGKEEVEKISLPSTGSGESNLQWKTF